MNKINSLDIKYKKREKIMAISAKQKINASDVIAELNNKISSTGGSVQGYITFENSANAGIVIKNNPVVSYHMTTHDNGNLVFGNINNPASGGCYIPYDCMQDNGTWYRIITDKHLGTVSVGGSYSTQIVPNCSFTFIEGQGVGYTVPAGGTWIVLAPTDYNDGHCFGGYYAGGSYITTPFWRNHIFAIRVG